jgi:hypothetical protein
MHLAVLSFFLVVISGFLFFSSWLLTIYHASGVKNITISLVLFLIPVSIIIYQIYHRKETKKAQLLLILAIVFSFVTYYILQLTTESIDTMARSLSK